MLLRETQDPLKLKRFAAEALKHNKGAFPQVLEPCEFACLFCQDCQRALGFVSEMLETKSPVVYEVLDDEDRKGVIWFTEDDVLHGFFTDHRLLGKAAVLRDAARTYMLRTGIEPKVMVPQSSSTVSHWLQGNGFTRVAEEDWDFYKNGKPYLVDVLTLETSVEE